MSPELDHLLSATTDEAAAWFAETDAVALVAAVRATPDDHLLRLFGRDEIRSVAVEGILARLHEYALHEQVARMRGVIRFDLERRGVVQERHGLVFDHGTLELLAHLPADEHADVVLTTSVVRFVRIVSGERNAGLEFLAGTLDIDGDAELALALGGIFRVPGTDHVAVDPRDLDPVEVARVLGHVKGDHLKKVMRSGFRHVVLDEIFRRLPEFVNDRKARNADVTVGFRLLGSPSGEIERYVVRVRDGAATVSVGDDGSERDATVTCEAHDFLRLATGHLSAVSGVLRGQLKVKGDRSKALQLSSVLDIPSAR
ncbi:MAG: SCP2 sterol-binding domain-containing protein [Nocardioides sp.]